MLLVKCDRSGASSARNEGLRHAQGDFIQYLDADDILDLDKIEIQINRLRNLPANMIASSEWSRFQSHPSEAIFAAEDVWRDLPSTEFLVSSWLGGGMMPLFAWLTPRGVIKAAGLWDETLSVNDDGEYFSRVLLTAAGIAFCEGSRGVYRSGILNSLSGRKDRKSAESDYKATYQSCNSLLKVNRSAQAMCACATAYKRFAYRYYPHYRDLTRKAEALSAGLGGADLKLEGSRKLALCSSVFGWKAARRMKYIKDLWLRN